MTSHSAGVDSKGWTLRGPPHKQRFCSLPTSVSPDDREKSHEFLRPINLKEDTSAEEILQHLQDHLFPSVAFRAWLAVVARVIPLGHHIETRRFRPGLDYTLAMGDETETRLDVVLGLTPEVSGKSTAAAHDQRPNVQSNGKGKEKDVSMADGEKDGDDELEGWDRGEWGGWECYLAHSEEDDDPAVYRSGSSRSKKQANGEGWSLHLNVDDKKPAESEPNFNLKPQGNDAVEVEENGDADNTMDEDDDDDEEDDDGILLTAQAGFNRLLLVLRDPGVLRFVKYVTASAPGSRWDVCGEYEIGMIESDDEDEAGNVDGPSTSEEE
ncbi:hypothetical protein SCHPADRAFT_530836 [Schizopora paradoxa]|uniref:Oxoglutarate/iron-dependent oxygenase C-terminal degradation domain-containing protein n=1 Tax=Schizopora paradoxa TaxID=27342 RepID=A0A0H2REY9_9AGAM|nr:hypothetical protein SCHPADRAFT_530836 [Schizopora paradoxa]